MFNLTGDPVHILMILALSLPEVKMGEKVALICFQASPVRLNICSAHTMSSSRLLLPSLLTIMNLNTGNPVAGQ